MVRGMGGGWWVLCDRVTGWVWMRMIVLQTITHAVSCTHVLFSFTNIVFLYTQVSPAYRMSVLNEE